MEKRIDGNRFPARANRQNEAGKARVDELLAIRGRALDRLSGFNPTGAFGAIAGIATDVEEQRMGEHLVLRRLTERPQISGSELTRSLPVTHELHFDVPPEEGGSGWVMEVMWTVIAVLRASSSGLFVVTEISDRSWEIADALSPGELQTRPLNLSIPPWFGRTIPAHVSPESAAWVEQHWFDVLDLRKDRVAHFMLECLDTSFGELDVRMSVNKVWAGIESFLGASVEIRFRLSTLVAAALESPGDSRFALYKKLQKLYDMRSRIVHGSAVDNVKVESHLNEARSILSLLIRLVIGRGSVPTIEELELLLLDPYSN